MLASDDTLAKITARSRPTARARVLSMLGIPYKLVGGRLLVLEDDVRRYIRGESGGQSEPDWGKLNAT